MRVKAVGDVLLDNAKLGRSCEDGARGQDARYMRKIGAEAKREELD